MPPTRSSRWPPTSSVRCRWPAPPPPNRSLPAPAKPRPRWSTASTDAANQVRSLAADIERSLSMAGTSTAEVDHRRRPRSPDHAGHRFVGCRQPRQVAGDRCRTHLTAVGADTAASILNSAREAQSSLAATSAEAASQIKAISADIERSLGTVTANTTDNIQTSARQCAERADRRLERSQLEGQVDLGRHRALGARRQRLASAPP